MTLVLMVQNITLFLLTTILNIYGFILCPINHVFTQSFLNFEILWKTGSTPKSKVYILTMEVKRLLLKIIYLFMALVIIPLLPTPHNKMEYLKDDIDTLLKQVLLFSPMPKCLFPIGLMHFKLQHT